MDYVTTKNYGFDDQVTPFGVCELTFYVSSYWSSTYIVLDWGRWTGQADNLITKL